MINHTEASTWSWTENLPTAGDSLSCPWSRKKQTKRSMYFRFFESMGLPWISMRRKKFQRQTTLWPLQRFAIFSYSAINNRSTIKSPDVYLLSEVVDQVLFIRPIRTQQISLAGRPSVHLTQRRGKNKANLLFCCLRTCSMSILVLSNLILSVIVLFFRTKHLGQFTSEILRPTRCFKTVSIIW